MSKKTFALFATAFGALTVACGMIGDNDLLFVIGTIILIAAYLVIRKEIKACLEKKSTEHREY
ncbi:MAG: hypothetical protein JRJ29_07150 [Deltaproteobacteria bacterium]|nr:hypothetical protein [Deltaproteobacteria bacterium]